MGIRLRRRVLIALTLGACASSALFALKKPEGSSRFDAVAIPDPSMTVSQEILGVDSVQFSSGLRSGWNGFKLANGPAWDIYLDSRSGAPSLVQGEGIPFIPGSGNSLQSAQVVTLKSLDGALRSFMGKNAALFVADDKELVLNEAGSGQLTPELWQVVYDRAVNGVPVVGDGYVFSIGHGNLISFGAQRWSSITASSVPSIDASSARGILRTYMGIRDLETPEYQEYGTLQFVPMAATGSTVDAFHGQVGYGYETPLAWRIVLSLDGEPGKWVGLVDAHSGEVLALYDDVKYATAKGGVFPVTDDAICPDGCEVANIPMPFTNITIGANSSTAGSMGAFTCAPGGSTATTTLSGQYIKVADVCGSISKGVTCDADLDMGTSAGTDCTTPGSGGAGNTHAARSSFYHLNRIKEHARAFLPGNAWLNQQLTDNVNIAQTCNANWNGSSVNFYKSGGGCRNTGEIASVFLHEWGHGLSANDGGGSSNPDEAYADIASFLLTHRSCIGRGFTSANCDGYGNACLNCTGVRDQDWNQHSTHAPQTADSWPASCPTGSGPCGREVHCEGYLPGEVFWDFAVRDLTAAGIDQQTAWQIVDKLWYVSRTGTSGNGYSCGAPASNRSCASTAWMQQIRVVDDDDGNLANGTPHAAAIFAAFNRHNIQCGAAGDAVNQSTSSCPSLVAPTLTPTGSNNQIALSWTAVPGASSYNVLRNDRGCDWGYNIIANVATTSYTDTGLPNGFPLYYSIQAVGSNSHCTGTLGTCTAAQAVFACTPSFAGLTTVTNPANSTCTLNLSWTAATSTCGGSIRYSVYRSTTSGFTPAAGNQIATGLTGTSYTDAVGIASGTTYYYIVRAYDTFNNIEESNVNQQSGAPTGPYSPLSWTDTFEGAQSGGGFDLAGWTHNTINGATNWAWSTAQKHDGTHSWFAQEITTTSDKVLTTPAFHVIAGTTMSFWHTFAFEGTVAQCYDAGTLEYTTNGGGTWTVVPAGDFTAGGYNGTASTVDTNPIGGKAAWCAGTIGALTQVTLNLGGDANIVNKDVQIRWHEGDDTGVSVTGWYVDTPNLTNAQQGSSCTTGVSCTPPGAPTLTGATGDCAGINLTWTAGTGSTSSYNVYRATVSGGPYTKVAGPLAGTSYSDTSAVIGTTYFYVVRGACDAGGNNESPNSNQLSSARLTTGSACNDGNACTQTDTCQGGVCTGSNPVICTASDQCHDVGTCAPATGICSNPAKTNGSACNDGNACTQTDTCQSGVCTGSNSVVCTASDQCHNAGTCAPATGVCSNPAKADGTSCNDANACTQTDSCQSGVCTGSNPVVCTASDQCHDVGTCAPATGVCSNPAKANGSACNDSNACTQTDTCQSGVCTGSNPVTCTTSDQCHDVGTCDTATGLCSNPAKANGSACSDGNACTQTDTCQSGVCTGSNPVTCTASDQCHDAGTCDTATGTCSNPAKADGTGCTDGNACTQSDSCQSGVCTGSNPVVCTASDQCHDIGTCDTATGACSNPAKVDGSACNDANACTQTDSCQSGVCTGSNPVTCTASDQCHDAGTCDTATGTCSNPAKADGSACNDANACTQTDSCQSGVCTGSNPVTCTASDQCHDIGTCDTGTGTCSNPSKADGSACNDGNACTQTDSCQSGACSGSNPVVCTASDQCHLAGTCDTGTGSCSNPSKPDGTACDDGNPCTTGDACGTGTCGGQPLPPPQEVNDSVTLATNGSTTTISWTDDPGSFNVYRGLRTSLPNWSYNQTCFAPGVTGPVTDTDTPAAGSTFFYLVTRETSCGESIPGHASNGTPIANNNACPPSLFMRAASTKSVTANHAP